METKVDKIIINENFYILTKLELRRNLEEKFISDLILT